MKVYILSSSRADYSIYFPLIHKLREDSFFDLRIVLFGTHLSEKYGYTANQYLADGITVYRKIETLPEGDLPSDIANSMGQTIVKFSEFWKEEEREADLIIGLGDRYEMLSAILASVPFNLPVAHIHGGEETLGAIDNVFRHSISLIARYHFTVTQHTAERIRQLKQTSFIYIVGALSLDTIKNTKLLSVEEFYQKFKVNLSKPTVLFTFHPETVNFTENSKSIDILLEVLDQQEKQVIITMPNSDTHGQKIREKIISFGSVRKEKIFLFESLGPLGYYSCMNYCSYLLGNSSSGIIEAASFSKFVINAGDRQKGRECSNNIFHVPIEVKAISEAIRKIDANPKYSGENIYGDGHTAVRIIDILKKINL